MMGRLKCRFGHRIENLEGDNDAVISCTNYAEVTHLTDTTGDIDEKEDSLE